ncbi:MAG: hypothetical protein ACTTH7_10095 [Treponema sp.]
MDLINLFDDEILNQGIPGTTVSIEDLVKNTPSADIQSFLIDQLKNDPVMLQQFKLKTRCSISQHDLKIYKHEIDSICKSHTDKYGYISYYDAHGFYSNLSEFLKKTVSLIIDNKEYTSALQLIGYTFLRLGKLNIDDSDGTTGALAYDCITLFERILAVCDMKLKQILYKKCKYLLLSEDVPNYLQTYIEEMLFSHFTEDEFLHDKLILSQAKVTFFLETEDKCSNEYNAQEWMQYHLQVMEELSLPQEDIDEYCKKYIRLSKIRTYYVDTCIQLKRYEEAVRLLEEGKLINKGDRRQLLEYSKKLQEIYTETQQSEKYKAELWRIILEYAPGDFDSYKKLKTYYTTDEWEEKREVIFKQKDIHTLDVLYAYDGLYDRLLQLVLKTDGLYYIFKYEDVLKDLAPKEILKRYEAVVREKAAYTSDRTTYHEIADLLKRMQCYPDGKALVQTLILEFRAAYRRRPAMMQELDNI